MTEEQYKIIDEAIELLKILVDCADYDCNCNPVFENDAGIWHHDDTCDVMISDRADATAEALKGLN